MKSGSTYHGKNSFRPSRKFPLRTNWGLHFRKEMSPTSSRKLRHFFNFKTFRSCEHHRQLKNVCTTISRDYLYLLFLQHITNVNWMLVLFNLIHIFVLIIFVALLPWGVTLASCHLTKSSCFEKKSRNARSEKSHSNKVNDMFIWWRDKLPKSAWRDCFPLK